MACAVPMLAAVIAQYGAHSTALGVVWAFWLAIALWRDADARVGSDGRRKG
jgi:hypothetical protein